MDVVIVRLQDCTKNRNEELSEAVPETLKNVLLVMASRGVLTRDWKVRGNSSMCLFVFLLAWLPVQMPV